MYSSLLLQVVLHEVPLAGIESCWNFVDKIRITWVPLPGNKTPVKPNPDRAFLKELGDYRLHVVKQLASAERGSERLSDLIQRCFMFAWRQ